MALNPTTLAPKAKTSYNETKDQSPRITDTDTAKRVIDAVASSKTPKKVTTSKKTAEKTGGKKKTSTYDGTKNSATVIREARNTRYKTSHPQNRLLSPKSPLTQRGVVTAGNGGEKVSSKMTDEGQNRQPFMKKLPTLDLPTLAEREFAKGLLGKEVEESAYTSQEKTKHSSLKLVKFSPFRLVVLERRQPIFVLRTENP